LQPPSLADYQSAANSIYQPQQQAEAAQLSSTLQQNMNTLESGKAQIGTDYQSAINQLTQSVQDQTGQINQLYSQRLGGNFSGLQGNDMGQMFSRANQQQSIISQTRANKLASITTQEGNAQLQYNTEAGNLGSKYASLENQYAQSGYAGAVKSYQAQQNSDRTFALGLARLQQSGANSGLAASKYATQQAQMYKVGYQKGGNGAKFYTGPNGSTNLYQFAAGSNGGDPTGTWNTLLQELSTGSTTDKAAYHAVTTGAYSKGSQQDKIAYLQKYHGYIFQ
jgi:hypothetical protein